MEAAPRPRSLLRAVLYPPRGGLSAADYLELRFLSVASFVLACMGLLTWTLLPAVFGFELVSFLINVGTNLGTTSAFVLAAGGRRRASATMLLAALVAAIWIATVRTADGPLLPVFIVSALLPILLAFTLRRFAIGLAVGAITIAYAFANAAWWGGDPAGAFSAIIMLMAGMPLAGVASFLRSKEAERATAAEAEALVLLGRLREAQEIAQVGSWEIDFTVDGVGVAWSDEMYHLFGRDKATFTAQYDTAFKAVHPDDLERVRTGFDDALRSANAYHEVEHRIILPDGSVRHLQERVRFVRDAAGRALRAVGTAQDVTDRRVAEEARAALERQSQEVARLNQIDRLRTEFLNAAAHDLKTPLTPLKLQIASMRLKRDRIPPEHREAIDLLDRNITRFAALVEDLLESARLQQGKVRLRREPTALRPLLEDAVETFRQQASHAGVELALGPVTDSVIEVDPPKCMQVIVNLVSNAVRYTLDGGRVVVDAVDIPGFAEVRVRDTGLGFSPEQLDQLFQPFARLHEDRMLTARGTGLGLYVSKGIVEQHGGRIWVESPGPGQGSTVHATLPLAAAGRKPARASGSLAEVATPTES